MNPSWYHNVVANRRVTIELGAETFAAVCSLPEGKERDRLFAKYLAELPDALRELMSHYQRQTTRQFRVVVIEPVQ